MFSGLPRAALAVFIIHVSSVFTQATSNVIDLGYATYEGFVDPNSNNTNFLGIRFAAPPTGSLRFAAPQAPATTPGVQAANALSAQCFTTSDGKNPVSPFKTEFIASATTSAQGKRSADAIAFSEDCLF